MNNSNFILVIDQGTTGSNCAFFDLQSLRLISSCKAEHAQIYPEPGWVEHDPGEIWQRCLEGIESAWRELTQKHPGAKRSGIACIGITNQRETTLAWNRRTSELAGPAIVWQDRRTADYCEALKRDAEFDKKLH
ncbi:MAG: glycerol kinase, partial [Proteobacteria bacterium]